MERNDESPEHDCKTESENLDCRCGHAAMTLVAVGLSGGMTTEKAPIGKDMANCGLFGDVCGKLTPGSKDQARPRYINPSARWTQYRKVMIDAVTFWGETRLRCPLTLAHSVRKSAIGGVLTIPVVIVMEVA